MPLSHSPKQSPRCILNIIFRVSENKRIFRGLTSPGLLFPCSLRKLREGHTTYPGVQARDLVAPSCLLSPLFPDLRWSSVTNMYPFVSFSVTLSTFLQLHATTSVYVCSVSHWLPKFPAPRLSRNHLTYCRWSHLFQNVYLIMSLLCSQFQLLPLSSDWRLYSFIDISLSRYLSTHCHLSLSYWNIRFFTFICLFILAAQHVGSSFPDQGLNLHPCIDFILFFALFWPHSIQDLSSPVRDQIYAPYSGSVVS